MYNKDIFIAGTKRKKQWGFFKQLICSTNAKPLWVQQTRRRCEVHD